MTGQLQHPAIPAVHDLGTLPDGRPFLAMKLVRGHTLADLLKERPSPGHDRGRFIAIFEQVCQAVAFAHEHRVLHRDLKPSNVMVGRFGEVQVMDWGLAKVMTATAAKTQPVETLDTTGTEIKARRAVDGLQTEAGSLLGTPSFMAPEQAAGEIARVDERSDVFGLGAILAVILTGEPVYGGGDSAAVRLMAVRGQTGECLARLAKCGGDPDLVALCRSCLAFASTDRPTDAAEVARTVAQLRAAAEQRARTAELEQVKAQAEAREQRKRRRVQLALAATLLLLLAGGTVVAWRHTQQESERQQRQARNAAALEALLIQSAEALESGDANRAATLLAEAERRLPEGVSTSLQQRFDDCRAALALLRRLDEIDRFRWTISDNRFPDWQELANRIRTAFADFGVVPGKTDPEEARRLVAESLVRDRLVEYLDRWLWIERPPAVLRLLAAVDPDAYRDAWRTAVTAGQRRQCDALAQRPEALLQPTGFMAVLGEQAMYEGPRGRDLLRAALVRRPANLDLLMSMGTSYSTGVPDDAAERVRWYQAAVTASPTNAATHTNLGSALDARGDPDGAMREYQEALRLDANFAPPHNGIGAILRVRGDLDGAMREFREAIQLNPNYARPHANLADSLREKGDEDGMIAEYREAIRLAPKDARPHNVLGLALRARATWTMP